MGQTTILVVPSTKSGSDVRSLDVLENFSKKRSLNVAFDDGAS